MHRISAAARLQCVLVVASLLAPLLAAAGCRKQQEQPVPSGGAIYYTGPKVPKAGPGRGGGSSAPR